jgi:hypothetical protein
MEKERAAFDTAKLISFELSDMEKFIFEDYSFEASLVSNFSIYKFSSIASL